MNFYHRIQDMDWRQVRSLYRQFVNCDDGKKPDTRLSKPELSQLLRQLESNHTIERDRTLSTPYGTCRMCDAPIAIPGLDAYLCSNPDYVCGRSGWVFQLWFIEGTISSPSL